MIFAYTLSVWFYYLLIKLASPFHKKARQWLEGRKNIFSRLEKAFEKNTHPVVWFHAASLGEFEQARPVIEGFRSQHPTHKILLTFFSPSGYEVRKNYEGADYIFYLPLDTLSNVERFIRIVKPQTALFVKYEFWHYYISELHKNNIPVISFSAIFRQEQIFFKPYGNFYRAILSRFSKIFVQDQQSLDLLRSTQLNNAEAAGDTRFDRVKQICDRKKEISIAQAFKNNKKLLVIGSAWKEDMEVLIPFINQFKEEIKIIVAPHEIKKEEIQAWIKVLNKRSVLFSEASETNVSEKDILFIDNIGMLSSLYQYAEFAYIGGAFGKGLHNTLEAVTFGMPVFFGPNYSKFKEARDLIRMKIAFSVRSTETFAKSFEEFYTQDDVRIQTALKAKEYILENTGASEKIIQYLNSLLSKQKAS